jgi:flagellar protein FliS
MDGALEKIQIARGCMERKEIARKCESIDWTLNILGGLHGSLDLERGGEVAFNLANIYYSMMRRLVDANVENDPAILDEVTRLLNELREAWNAIRT